MPTQTGFLIPCSYSPFHSPSLLSFLPFSALRLSPSSSHLSSNSSLSLFSYTLSSHTLCKNGITIKNVAVILIVGQKEELRGNQSGQRSCSPRQAAPLLPFPPTPCTPPPPHSLTHSLLSPLELASDSSTGSLQPVCEAEMRQGRGKEREARLSGSSRRLKPSVTRRARHLPRLSSQSRAVMIRLSINSLSSVPSFTQVSCFFPESGKETGEK